MKPALTTVPLPLTGGCLCGACRYELRAAPHLVYLCHCTDCQRQSGSAFSMSMPAPNDAFAVTKGDPARFERTMQSGRRTTVRFCGSCGSRVFAQASAQVVVLRPGTLDDTRWVVPAAQNYRRSAMHWACYEGLPSFDEAPPSFTELARAWQALGVRFQAPDQRDVEASR